MNETIEKLLTHTPDIFYDPPILFHGTSRRNFESISKEGLKTRDGYSTVTLNPKVAYSLYAKKEMSHGKDLERKDDSGVLLLIKPIYFVGPGMNASISLLDDNVIDGETAEWIKGNLGFYLSESYLADPKKELVIPPQNILAALPVDEGLEKLFNSQLKNFRETEMRDELTSMVGEYLRTQNTGLPIGAYSEKIYTAVRASQIVELIRRTTYARLYDIGYELRRLGGTIVDVQEKEGKRSLYFKLRDREKLSDLTIPSKSGVRRNLKQIDRLSKESFMREYLKEAKVFLEKTI